MAKPLQTPISQVAILRQLLELRAMQDPNFELAEIKLTFTGRCSNGEHQKYSHVVRHCDVGASLALNAAIQMVQDRIAALENLQKQNLQHGKN